MQYVYTVSMKAPPLGCTIPFAIVGHAALMIAYQDPAFAPEASLPNTTNFLAFLYGYGVFPGTIQPTSFSLSNW